MTGSVKSGETASMRRPPDFAVLNPGYLLGDNSSIHIEAKGGNFGPSTP
jgi:hypothetical protein